MAAQKSASNGYRRINISVPCLELTTHNLLPAFLPS